MREALISSLLCFNNEEIRLRCWVHIFNKQNVSCAIKVIKALLLLPEALLNFYLFMSSASSSNKDILIDFFIFHTALSCLHLNSILTSKAIFNCNFGNYTTRSSCTNTKYEKKLKIILLNLAKIYL